MTLAVDLGRKATKQTKVELAFSIMDEVIDDKSARTDIKTYSAIQSVKCILKAEGRDAVDYLRKADYLRDPVHLILVYHMMSHLGVK